MAYSPGTPTSLVPCKVVRCSFADVGSGLVTSDMKQLGATGAGMTISQANGNLLVATGTNANAEFLARSVDSVANAFAARAKALRSQHIVNQHAVVALADLVAENISFTTDATGLVITVTAPGLGNRFTAKNIGQGMNIGGVTGVAQFCPGRYVITGVLGDSITLEPKFDCTWTRSSTTATVTFNNGGPIFSLNQGATVSNSSDTAAIVNGAVTLLTQASGGVTTFTCLNAGATSGTLTLQLSSMAWTASGTGTLTLYGWNAYELVYNGTSATTVQFDARRKGWGLGATLASVSTVASPGHYTHIQTDTTSTGLFSAAAGTGTTPQFTQAASRFENVPDGDLQLFFFLHVFNGVSAPASTTTYTVGFFSLEELDNVKVHTTSALPTASAVTVTQTTAANLTALVTGAAGQGSTASGNPVFVGGVAKTAQPTARTDGQIVAPLFGKLGHFVTKPFQVRDLTDSGNAAQLTTTTETTLVAAVASTFNDLVGVIISSTATFTGSPTAVSLDFRDTTAGTVRFSVSLPLTPGPIPPVLLPDIFKQSTVNTNWTVQLVFTGGTSPAIGAGNIRVAPMTVRNI